MGARMRQEENNEERMLITRAKQGNVEAYEALVRKYQQSIYYLCRRMTGSHQSADDLSQDTFIKAYFALDRFKDGMNFFTWIRKIAVEKGRALGRKRRKHSRSFFHGTGIASGNAPTKSNGTDI
jgi:RNA polymerase sigma-70 factor (ECF subfamily)